MLDENSVFYNTVTFHICKWYNVIYKILISLALIKKRFVNIITITHVKNETFEYTNRNDITEISYKTLEENHVS